MESQPQNPEFRNNPDNFLVLTCCVIAGKACVNCCLNSGFELNMGFVLKICK